jgi:hypothetical protein
MNARFIDVSEKLPKGHGDAVDIHADELNRAENSDAGYRSASEETPRLLWNQKLDHHVH